MPASDVHLIIDDALLRRVIQNLLSNVVKHGAYELAVIISTDDVLTVVLRLALRNRNKIL